MFDVVKAWRWKNVKDRGLAMKRADGVDINPEIDKRLKERGLPVVPDRDHIVEYISGLAKNNKTVSPNVWDQALKEYLETGKTVFFNA